MALKKLKNLSFFLIFLPFLVISCGKGVDARKYPPNPKERVKKNMEEGRGFKVMDVAKKKTGSTNYEFASSNELPILPPGWNILNFSFEKFLWCITVVAKQSPSKSVIVVLEVGTIPVTSDSLTFGKSNLISLAFNKVLSALEATPIILILYRLAYFSIFDNSDVLPE